MRTKNTNMKNFSFQLNAEDREDFLLLIRMMPNNPSPTAYMRKLVQAEIEKHRELIEETKKLRMTMLEGEMNE